MVILVNIRLGYLITIISLFGRQLVKICADFFLGISVILTAV